MESKDNGLRLFFLFFFLRTNGLRHEIHISHLMLHVRDFLGLHCKCAIRYISLTLLFFFWVSPARTWYCWLGQQTQQYMTMQSIMATYLSSLLFLSIDARTILQKHNHILKDHTNLVVKINF